MIIKNFIETFRNFNKKELTSFAGLATYNLILSFFPFLIMLIAILNYTPIDNEEVLTQILSFIPKTSYDLVFAIINEIKLEDSQTIVSLGLLSSIWVSSNGTKALIKGVSKSYNEKEKINFIKIRVISVVMTFCFALSIVLLISFIVFGKHIAYLIFDFLKIPKVFITPWYFVKYFMPLIFIIFILTIFYKFCDIKKRPLKKFYKGALFSSVIWILMSILFSFYVNNFSNYNKMYGSIGGIIALLLWLYLSSIIILLGAEYNTVIEEL
ncbi:MAG: YihY/virulence factor BrkB family protein [Peptostreptococcaceae bacterium]|jgi:membrane protein|nr:YihY/virulence factor BrkB family protein [Peptostreptococcaceae bacterium]